MVIKFVSGKICLNKGNDKSRLFDALINLFDP